MNNFSAPDFSTPSLDASIIPAVDRDYGFLGIKLGTPLDRLPGLTFHEKRGDVLIYTRTADSLQVGLATASYIEYWFRNDTLHDIVLGFDDAANGMHLRNAFSRVYGRGFGTDKLVWWKGQYAEMMYTVKEGDCGYLSVGVLDSTPAGEARTQVISLNSIAGKTVDVIEKILGKPEEQELVSPRNTPCQEQPCVKAIYQNGQYEVVFINGVADWITIHQTAAYDLDTSIIEQLGLPKMPPTFSNSEAVMRWEHIAGLREVSFFNNGSGKVSYIYIKCFTK